MPYTESVTRDGESVATTISDAHALPPALLVTITAQAGALQAAFARMAEAVRPLGERMANVSRAIGEAAGAGPILASDLDWEAQSAVCCHVCGPDPGHCCDARATTSITHPLPSGGTRTLPLCDPCAAAESAESAAAVRAILAP